MITQLRKLAQGLRGASGPGALMLGLALLTAGCASGSSSRTAATTSGGMTSEELFNEYDTDNDNQIDQTEWDATYRSTDVNGDGVVSQEEFAAGGFGGRR